MRERIEQHFGDDGYLGTIANNQLFDNGTTIHYLRAAINEPSQFQFLRLLDKLNNPLIIPEAERHAFICALKAVNDLCFNHEIRHEKQGVQRTHRYYFQEGAEEDLDSSTISSLIIEMSFEVIYLIQTSDPDAANQEEKHRKTEQFMPRYVKWRTKDRINLLPHQQYDPMSFVEYPYLPKFMQGYFDTQQQDFINLLLLLKKCFKVTMADIHHFDEQLWLALIKLQEIIQEISAGLQIVRKKNMLGFMRQLREPLLLDPLNTVAKLESLVALMKSHEIPFRLLFKLPPEFAILFYYDLDEVSELQHELSFKEIDAMTQEPYCQLLEKPRQTTFLIRDLSLEMLLKLCSIGEYRDILDHARLLSDMLHPKEFEFSPKPKFMNALFNLPQALRTEFFLFLRTTRLSPERIRGSLLLLIDLNCFALVCTHPHHKIEELLAACTRFSLKALQQNQLDILELLSLPTQLWSAINQDFGEYTKLLMDYKIITRLSDLANLNKDAFCKFIDHGFHQDFMIDIENDRHAFADRHRVLRTDIMHLVTIAKLPFNQLMMLQPKVLFALIKQAKLACDLSQENMPICLLPLREALLTYDPLFITEKHLEQLICDDVSPAKTFIAYQCEDGLQNHSPRFYRALRLKQAPAIIIRLVIEGGFPFATLMKLDKPLLDRIVKQADPILSFVKQKHLASVIPSILAAPDKINALLRQASTVDACNASISPVF
jgi:hypothetical protein